MPGILCSAYNPTDSTIEPKWRRSLELVQHHPEHILEQYSEPGFQLACLYHPEVCQGPHISVTERFVLACYGRIYEDDWASVADGEPLCRVLLDHFMKHGVDALKHRNGRYDIAVWDRRARVLHFVSDRFGANRHYYFQRPGALHVGCEVKALAVELDRIEVDPVALASMLTFGYHIGDLTILKEVKCLPSACHLEYHAADERLTINRYWNYPYGETEPLPGTEAELAEALHAHLLTALKRQLRGVRKILLPISGGLDSRTLAGLLAQSDFAGEVLAYSYGQLSSRDVRYGRAIARKLGYRHVTIPTPPDFVTRYVEDAAWRFDAEWSAKNGWIRYAHQQPVLGDIRGYTLLHGLMGDIVLGSDVFGYQRKAGDDPQPVARLREVFLTCHVSYMPLSELGKVFAPVVSNKIEARLNAIVDLGLEPLKGLKPFHALLRAEFEHRQRRRTAWLVRCVEEDVPAITPFLDRDVVDFATRIPYPLFPGKHLYMRMIRRHLPEMAAIPLSATGLPLSPTQLRAGIAWRIGRLLRPFPTLRNYLAKRRDLLNFEDGLREQTDFFRARLNVLEELSPPLPPGSATRRMEGLLTGTEQPLLQACALLPPAIFVRRMHAEMIGKTGSEQPKAPKQAAQV